MGARRWGPSCILDVKASLSKQRPEATTSATVLTVASIFSPAIHHFSPFQEACDMTPCNSKAIQLHPGLPCGSEILNCLLQTHCELLQYQAGK